jgi:predicted nucleic acid-binding protein
MAGRTGGPLTRQLAFWDASALVPLCVRQTNTPQSLLWRRRYQTVIWWLTPVEIASALARLLRIGQLDTNGWGRALKLGRALDEAWFVIKPTEALRTRAVDIVKRYDLRAADALQLAAAVEWCEAAPRGRKFLSVDKKLREAATLIGFDAYPE